jgi:hypothetical protein
MPLTPILYDSVQPALIPEKARQKPNGIMAYLDGEFAWTPGMAGSFPRGWWITVIGDPARAGKAREIDVETGDATPADVKPYHAARTALGARTIVYCDLSTVAAVQEADANHEDLWWHLAWWTGRIESPTVIADQLQQVYGVTIDPGRILAQQYADRGNYDVSAVFSDPRWIHP